MSEKFTIPDSESGFFRFVLMSIQKGCDEKLEVEIPEHKESVLGSMISRLVKK